MAAPCSLPMTKLFPKEHEDLTLKEIHPKDIHPFHLLSFLVLILNKRDKNQLQFFCRKQKNEICKSVFT